MKKILKLTALGFLLASPVFAHDEDGHDERDPGPFLAVVHKPAKGSNEEQGAISIKAPFDKAALSSLATFRERYPKVRIALDQVANALYKERLPILSKLLKDERVESVQLEVNLDRPFYEARNQVGFESAKLVTLVQVDEMSARDEIELTLPLDLDKLSESFARAADSARLLADSLVEETRKAEAAKKREEELRLRAEEIISTDPFFEMLPKR